MERLTFLNGDDMWCVDNDHCFEEQSEHYCGPAIERLAGYEDTGLEPEEIIAVHNFFNNRSMEEFEHLKAKRKPRPDMPYWFWLGQDGCWFCKNKNNCNQCKANRAYAKENMPKK